MGYNRYLYPKRTNSSFRIVSLLGLFFFISVFLSLGCASLLPEERRVYPKNPIPLPKGMDIHDWMNSKQKQFPNHLQSYTPYSSVYKIVYYRKKNTSIGSYISCGAYLRQNDTYAIEIFQMISMINYSDYTKSLGRYNKGGDLGPMSEKERTEILLPCMEEFLEPPQTKE